MGFFSKIGKVLSSVGKTIGKIAKSVVKSDIFKIASTALSFIPGLNGVGLIGKALSLLGDTSKVQNFFKTGLNLFQNLVGKFGLAESLVKNLNVLPFNPLGMLWNRIGGIGRAVSGLLPGIQPFAGLMTNAANLLRAALKDVLPWKPLLDIGGILPNWNAIVRQLPPAPISTNILNQLIQPENRMNNVLSMLQMITQMLGGSAQMPPGGLIIR